VIVRYYGHAGQRTGYGRAACEMIKALLTKPGVRVELRALAPYNTLSFDFDDLPLASMLYNDGELTPNPDFTIVHTLPLDCPRVVEIATREGTLSPGATRLVAYTTWEASSVAPPHVVEPYAAFEQWWHPSVKSLGAWPTPPPRKSAVYMPHAFDPESLSRRRGNGEAVRGERFTFYFIGAWTRRKNPEGLIRAYVHAFKRSDDVELLLHCPGVTQHQILASIAATGVDPHGGDLPRIRYHGNYVADRMLEQIHQGADCFVTATRGEAWNLPAFEAVLANRHVIATSECGHDGFLEGTSADVVRAWDQPASVDVRAVTAGAGQVSMQTVGAQGLTSRCLWREPDLLHLSGIMRHVYETQTRDLRVEYDLIASYGYQAVGDLAVSLLR
jgi:glycosyltransferase involved in cell wall biosynthesis